MDRQFKKVVQEKGLEEAGRFYGLYHGIVVENEDPEKRGRLRVKVPSIFGDQVLEEWIYGKSIFSGDTIGIWAIPSTKSGVWISFVNGEASMPIWEMGWFSDKAMPKEFKDRYLDGISLKHDRIFIQSKEASIELFEDGKIDIVGKADISVFTTGGKIELKNSTQNLKGLLNELKEILLTLKVAMNGTPLSNSLTPDTIASLSSWSFKVNQLLK
ncbi:phage baseplate assembly protein V [Bernardetia sp.]|uniref:phage baseplate assembly protein V n=1 Tax=Bernardetia sp. TaxID=1937974 RepID=UPI0025C43B8F|nr:phage baseplate assembly protein V [Bernardetia sp.]